VSVSESVSVCEFGFGGGQRVRGGVLVERVETGTALGFRTAMGKARQAREHGAKAVKKSEGGFDIPGMAQPRLVLPRRSIPLDQVSAKGD